MGLWRWRRRGAAPDPPTLIPSPSSPHKGLWSPSLPHTTVVVAIVPPPWSSTTTVPSPAVVIHCHPPIPRRGRLRVLVDLLEVATWSALRVKENAVLALLNLVRSGGDEVVKELVKEVGSGWDGIAEVEEKGNSARSKNKATDMLNLLEEKDHMTQSLTNFVFDSHLSTSTSSRS